MDPSSNPERAERMRVLLSDGRPRTLAEIGEHFGVDLTALGFDELDDWESGAGLDDSRYHVAPDGSWIDLRRAAQGRRFTVRLDPGATSVPVEPDLDLVFLAADDAVALVGAGPGSIGPVDDHDLAERFTPPPGWLPEGARLVALSWRGEELACEAVEVDSSESARVAERVAATFAEVEADGGESAAVVDLLTLALVGDDTLFRTPVEPVGELLARAGLERRGDDVGRAGTDWRTPGEIVRAERRALHEEVYGFEGCCHDAFDALEAAALEVLLDEPVDVAVAVDALGHGQVAEAFATDIADRADDPLDASDMLIAVADALAPAADGRAAAGAHYLRGIGLDWRDDATEADEAFRAALDADPDHESALAEAATFAEERGDGPLATALLQRLGVAPDDDQLARLREHGSSPRPRAGRNDPCPCGSGRKYKACCLGTERRPLAERMRWRYERAAAFMQRPMERGAVVDLAALSVPEGDDEAFVDAVRDPLIVDVALFEHGGLDRYHEARAPLMPADELAQIRRWPGARRRLYEIGPGDSGLLELRDAVDGSARTVDAAVEPPPTPGMHVLARAVPVEDGHILVGPVIDVPEGLRAGLRDLVAGPAAEDPAAWMAWIRAVGEAAG